MPGKKTAQNDGSPSYDDLIRQAQDFIKTNDLDSAIQTFQDILKAFPNDASIHNNLGVLYFRKEAFETANDFLLKASEIDPHYTDPLYNMARIFIHQKENDKALLYLDKCLAIQPAHEKAGKLKKKIQMASFQTDRKKIAVCCLPDLANFLDDIVAFLKTKYDVKTCYSSDGHEVEAIVRWADIIWIEWANELAVSLTNHPTCLNGKHVICRLHRYEAFSEMPGSVDWNKVDVLITVGNEYVSDALKRNALGIENKVKIIKILNGINIEKFKYVDLEKGKNIASLGFLNMRKNPMFLIHCFHQLIQQDPSYNLFFGGDFQDEKLQQYIYYMVERLSLKESVHFDGWQESSSDWLSDKHYLVSTSIGEGHPVGIMEAMATGVKPVIHNFPGAESFYPAEYIFNDSDAFCRIILDKDYDRKKYRDFIKEHYSIKDQLMKIDHIIEELVVRE